jgi:hypothetical protein
MKYDLKKRVFLLKKYFEFKEIVLVQRAYRTEFKCKDAPSHCIIKNIAFTFEKTGSVMYMAPKLKEISKKRNDAVNQVKKVISENPTLSSRKAVSLVNVSRSLILSVLHDDLHLKSYKIQEWQKLEPHDYQKRVDFANWFLNRPKNSEFNLICCDEAWFFLTQPINKQNNRFWSESRPLEGIELPLHDEKVMVWCAISANKVYGPYFFLETVNQYNYLKMLQDFFWPKQLRTADYEKYYFQQDGATPHTANIVQEWLTSKFGSKFIDKLKWPPRSPDLNPCDFYLWGYLKSKVYNPLPKTLDDLKANIINEIKKISKDVLKLTFSNFKKRCELVINAEGGFIEEK